jgi:lipopolysaccharide transport system permease protein
MWVLEYYDLIRILTISDLRIKYQSSVLGFLWSFISPLLMLTVMYIVFSTMRGISDKEFIVYLLTGIISWRAFSMGTSASIRGIYGKPALVKKIYIPRQILILSIVISSFISSLLEFLILFALLIILSIPLSLNVFLFPVITAIYFGIVFGVGLALGSLFIFYRDLDQIWSVVMQIGLFLVPIFYQVTSIPPQYQAIYLLNPVSAIMVMYRDILLYAAFPSLTLLGYSVLASAIILAVGTLIFRRMEPRFAEGF